MVGLGFQGNSLSFLIINIHSVYAFFDFRVKPDEDNYYRDFLNSIMRQICCGCAETAYIRMKAEQHNILRASNSIEIYTTYIKSMDLLKFYL